MNTYKINRNTRQVHNGRIPGKENTPPVRRDPDPDPPQTQPEHQPKRKKKERFEIVM